MMLGAWPIKKIEELCDVTSSKRIYAKELTRSGVPFLKSKEIIDKVNGKVIHANALFISEERYQQIIAHSGALEEGDVLLTSRGTLGVPYVIRATDRFHFADGNLTWFRNFRGLNSKFLRYWLLSPMGKAQLQTAVIGAAQQAYTIASLKKMELSYPSIVEQNRIVAILSAYDDLIENNRRRIAILEEMARHIYEEWFVHFRFPGHEDATFIETENGLIPSNWKIAAFTTLAKVMSGGTPKKNEPSYWGGAIPFYTPKDAPSATYALSTDAYITTEGLSRCNSKLYPKDTVFVTARGTVGKTALSSCDMAMNQSCYALKPLEPYGPLFLFLALREAVHELKTRSHGAVFDTIIVDTFKQLEVVVPDPEITVAFEGKVRPIFDMVLNLQRKNENLRSQRDILLPKLISGEIDVSKAEEVVGGEAA